MDSVVLLQNGGCGGRRHENRGDHLPVETFDLESDSIDAHTFARSGEVGELFQDQPADGRDLVVALFDAEPLVHVREG